MDRRTKYELDHLYQQFDSPEERLARVCTLLAQILVVTLLLFNLIILIIHYCEPTLLHNGYFMVMEFVVNIICLIALFVCMAIKAIC